MRDHDSLKRGDDDRIVEVSCLGPVQVLVDQNQVLLSAGQRMAVALLVAAGPGGLTADELVSDLHREQPGSGKQTAVMLISRLRRKIPKSAITIGGRYAIDPAICDVDAWRFSRLAASDPVHAAQLWGNPFAGLSDFPLRLRTEAERLRELYKRTLEAAAWLVRPGEHEDVLASVLVELTTDPLDEALTASAAAAMYRLGRQTDALLLVRRCRDELVEVHGLDPTQVLEEAETAILNHHHKALAARVDDRSKEITLIEPPPVGIFAGEPPDLIGNEAPQQTLLAAIDRLTNPPPTTQPGELLVVRAAAGAGKTATVAKVLAERRNGQVRIRIGRTDEDGIPYGPILEALPELASDIRALAAVGDPIAERNSAARLTQHLIDAMTTERPLVLTIEDAHAADSQTLALLRSITSKPLPTSLLLIITTRPATPDTEWNEALTAMVDGDGALLEIEPLTLENIETIVNRDHADEGHMQRAQFARRVYELSNGNALIASILSRDAPPQLNTILLPETISPEASLSAHLRRLIDDPGLEDLLTSAALIGRRFSVDLLAFVVHQTIDQTLEHLRRAEVFGVCEPADEGFWQFDHLLTVNYFSNRMPLLRPLVFSRIARHDAAPIESMPRYVAGAGDNLSAEFAYQALVRSGRDRRAAFAFPEALAALSHALELAPDVDGDEMELLLDLAECASRTGDLQAASDYRADAFTLARAADDHNAMSRAALAGLPSGEFAGGEPDRLEMLRKVDPARVTHFSPEFLARHLFRMKRIGEANFSMSELAVEIDDFLAHAKANQCSDALTGLGDTEDARALRFEQLMGRSLSKEARPIAAELRELSAELAPGPLLAEARHREIVAAITEQEPGAFGGLFDQIKQDVHEQGSARSRWSMDVLEAALDLSGSRPSPINVDAALRSGVRWGIPDAHDSWFVQLWMTAYIHGMYAEALAGLDASRDQIADNLAWHAGEALCAAKVGDIERARREVKHIGKQLPDQSEGPWSQTVAALLAETAAALDDPAAAQVAYDALVPHSGRAIVLGVGSAYFGPVDRYLGLAMSVLDAPSAASLFHATLEQSLCKVDVWARRANESLAALGLRQ